MSEETIKEMTEEVQDTAINENVETKENTPATVEPETPAKRTRKRVRKEEPQEVVETKEEEITVSVNAPNPELEEMKAQLAAMQQEKQKLEEERTALNEQITKLQEEVKITPQKLGQAIKEMGISPLNTKRENPQGMTLEAYNSMTDSQRREWQRKNRTDYLQLMHTIKLNG